MSDEPKTRDQKIAEFQAAKAEREAADAKRLREEVEDLEMRFDAELGPRGQDWEIVETPDGAIVVAIGTVVAWKKFSESKMTMLDVENFVRPLVKYPEAARYMALVDKRPAYAVRCANALATLYGAKGDQTTGKF